MRDGLKVTVVGWAASPPKQVLGSATPFTSFRLGTTPRRFDLKTQTWVDGQTEWLTVKVFRDAAWNVASSVDKGHPIIAHGRLETDEWVGEDGVTRRGLALVADAVGHDLTRGSARFVRTVVRSAAPEDDGRTAADDAARAADAAGVAADPWDVDGSDVPPPAEDDDEPLPDDVEELAGPAAVVGAGTGR